MGTPGRLADRTEPRERTVPAHPTLLRAALADENGSDLDHAAGLLGSNNELVRADLHAPRDLVGVARAAPETLRVAEVVGRVVVGRIPVQQEEVGHPPTMNDDLDDEDFDYGPESDYWKRPPYRVQQTRQRRMEKVRAFKDGKSCDRCGESDPRCLDLHHRDPNTKHKAFKSGRGWSDIALRDLDAELEKCDVLCANCHRKEHNGSGDIRHLL